MASSSLLKKHILLLIFFDEVSIGLILPFLPKLFMEMSFGQSTGIHDLSNETYYSFSIAILPLMGLLGHPILGRIADLRGQKKTIFYCLLVIFLVHLATLSSVLFFNAWIFFISRAIQGFMIGTYACCTGLISRISSDGEDRLRNFKKIQIYTTAGLACGALIPILIENLNLMEYSFLNIVLAMSCFIGLLNICVYYLIYRRSWPINKTEQGALVEQSRLRVIDSLKKSLFALTYIFHGRRKRRLSLAFSLYAFGTGLFLQSIPLYLNMRYSYGPSQISLFFVVMFLIMGLSTSISQRLQIKRNVYYAHFERFILICSSLLLINILISFSSDTMFSEVNMLLTWCVSAIFYTLYPIINVGFNNLFAESGAKSEQSRVLAGNRQIEGLAACVSGVFLGSLIPYYPGLLLTSAMCLFSSIILMKYFVKKEEAYQEPFAEKSKPGV